jgi:hypothetical protein
VKLLTRKINRKEEDREIEIETWYDHPEPGTKTTIRLDTGAIISTAPMQPAEKQMEIPLPVINAEEGDPYPDEEAEEEAVRQAQDQDEESEYEDQDEF